MSNAPIARAGSSTAPPRGPIRISASRCRADRAPVRSARVRARPRGNPGPHEGASVNDAIIAEARPATAAPPSAAPRHVFLVDGSRLIFRAYHALPPLNRSDGTPTAAVLGSSNMLAKLLSETDA